jgi:hypothetical protein
MKTRCFTLILALCGMLAVCRADDITTLDGHKYENVKDVALRHTGLYFVYGTGDSMHGVTVPFNQLSDDTKQKYHYDPFEMGLAYARKNIEISLNKNLAFSLADLEAAKKKAKAEKKMIGFIMEWDTMLVPARPLERGSDSGLAHFYDVFNDGLVLVFVRHETELNNVPDAVKQGFTGPEEGGFAPNMAVVTADCLQFICEVPYGGDKSNGAIREKIFRTKIADMKEFVEEQAAPK